MKNRVTIKVGGKEYTLVGVESEEYIQKVALYVNKKMIDVMKSDNTLSTASGAVLVALNIADEYIKETEKSVIFEKKLADMDKNIEELKEENERLKRENAMLKGKCDNFKLELVKRETELKEVRNNMNRR